MFISHMLKMIISWTSPSIILPVFWLEKETIFFKYFSSLTQATNHLTTLGFFRFKFALFTLLPLRFLVCLMLELLWKIWTFCLQGVAYECDCTFWCVLCQCIEKYWKICDFKTNLANRNYDVGIYVRDHWNPQLVEQQGLLLLVL